MSRAIKLGANQAMCLSAIRREGCWPGGWTLDNPSTTVRVLDSLARVGLVQKSSVVRTVRNGRGRERETFTTYRPVRGECAKCSRKLSEETGELCLWCSRGAKAAEVTP